MTKESFNCAVCANEFNSDELESIATSSNFKICEVCLEKSDPTNDYSQARRIIDCYFEDPIKLFKEARLIIDFYKK